MELSNRGQTVVAKMGTGSEQRRMAEDGSKRLK